MRRTRHLIVLFLVTFVTWAVVRAHAQRPSVSIGGFIMDMDGGIIPGATVRLMATPPAGVVETVSNARGAYGFPGLQAGTYSVTFSLLGFRTGECAGVVVQDGVETKVSTFLELDLREVVITHQDPPSAVQVAEEARPKAPICIGTSEIPVVFEARHDDGWFRLVLLLDGTKAPQTSTQFLKLVAAGAYQGGAFARVAVPVANLPSGLPPRDPSAPASVIEGRINSGFSGSIPLVPLEPTSVTGLRHKAGTVSMVRGDAVDVPRPTFMILLGDDPSFDAGGRRYPDRKGAAAFGRLVLGLEGLRKLGATPVSISSASIPEPFKPR